MKVQQISIFLENRAGRLETVTELLAKAAINIRALSLADTSDFGILRLIVNEPARAEALLRENHFTLSITDVVAVEIPDVPGGLDRVLRVLKSKKLNVEYMYAFIEKMADKAVIVFRFDNIDEAVEALRQAQIRILKNEEVIRM